MDSRHATAVLILSPQGTPLVRDPKKPVPHYWKLPGGRSVGDETPEECAVREVWEEIGITIDQDDLQIIEQQDRGNHTVTFFSVQVPSLANLKSIGDEDEEISVFPSVATLLELPDFFPNHREILRVFLDSKA